ncbi:hypothetical protein [Dyella sp. C9]|uniref:hypothetical protein n=1 Tax=Dyella sp. C9 TaxID=2202154 RepID=UPI000DEEC59D|nr:hypothetical protein [Dyella sp. C9]
MNINRSFLAGTIALLGIAAALHPSNLLAQTNADIAKDAFQTTVQINLNNFNYTAVTIPSGKRLVVQSVNIAGFAATTGAYVQPVIVVASELGSNGYNYDYFAPQPSTDPTEFYGAYPTTIYGDALMIGPAFSGYTPNSMALGVEISGYLVDVPKTAASAIASQADQSPDLKQLGNRSAATH